MSDPVSSATCRKELCPLQRTAVLFTAMEVSDTHAGWKFSIKASQVPGMTCLGSLFVKVLTMTCAFKLWLGVLFPAVF